MNFEKGQYGYDLEVIQQHHTTIELVAGPSRLVMAPELQGRVMTSTTSGNDGFSFGWVNHDLLLSENRSEQFNPFGGEERFWIGPEGGQFSFYFEEGKPMEMQNWKVPAAIDKLSWDVLDVNAETATFRKVFSLKNFSGNIFDLEVTRRVTIIDPSEITDFLPVEIGNSVRAVAYESLNQLKNMGSNDWTKTTGMPSIWMLSMYRPSAGVTMVIPFSQDGDGPVVTDDYFGKVPESRLKVGNGVIFFKADGNFRSKIGVSPERALPVLGSYDSVNRCLSVLACSLDPLSIEYVNSSWEEKQELPFKGDAINAYNDGPLDDGKQLGPFYELESSSSAAALKAGEIKLHVQRTFHFEGQEEDLNLISEKILGVSIGQITNAFQTIN